MASSVTEEVIINKLATHMRTVSGMKQVYGFAENPDQLHDSIVPAAIFYPMSGEQGLIGHHNRWRNTINIRGLVFITPRQGAGGVAKILENRALVFPQRLRDKFQEDSVIRDLLSAGLYEAVYSKWRYGSGGEFLTYAGVEYIGFVLDFIFKEGK